MPAGTERRRDTARGAHRRRADVYDALTTKRPYKDAFPHEKAVGILQDASGAHFDPDVVEAFLRGEKEFADIAARLRDTTGGSREMATTGVVVTCTADAVKLAERRWGPSILAAEGSSLRGGK